MGRMDLFDKLNDADPPIVRSSGDIVKCMDDQREGFQVGAARCSSSSTVAAVVEMQAMLWSWGSRGCNGNKLSLGPTCMRSMRNPWCFL